MVLGKGLGQGALHVLAQIIAVRLRLSKPALFPTALAGKGIKFK